MVDKRIFYFPSLASNNPAFETIPVCENIWNSQISDKSAKKEKKEEELERRGAVWNIEIWICVSFNPSIAAVSQNST